MKDYKESNKIRIILLPILLLLILAFYGCNSQSQIVLKSDYCTDIKELEHFFVQLDIADAEYEMLYPSKNTGGIRIIPEKPRNPIYRGFIYLSSEEVERLNKDYVWKECTTENPYLGQVNGLIDKNDIWYESEQFNKDVFVNGRSEKIRYNRDDTILFMFGDYPP